MKTVKYWACGHLTVTTRTNPPAPSLGAKKAKTFTIDWGAYRKIVSGVYILFQQSKNTPQFLTLTSRIPIHPTAFVRAQTLWIKNMIKNYGLNQYVWVLEYHKSGQPHTHIVADVPHFDVGKVQTAWNSAMLSAVKFYGVKELFVNSPYELLNLEKSTVRLPENNPVKKYQHSLKDAEGMGKYMAKYASKAVHDRVLYPCRCYGVSRNIDTSPINIDYGDFCRAIYDGEIDLTRVKWKMQSENIEIYDFFAQKSKLFESCNVY